ncbi:MAG: NAD-dependent epimerase/dehydratase family protein [Methylocystis sp.]
MPRKILITGGAGNIGGSLARRFVVAPDTFVTIVDDLSTGSRDKLPSSQYRNWELIKANVNRRDEIAAIMISRNFDYVFHYAAVVGVRRTLDNPRRVLDDIAGIENVLELSKNTAVKRIFFSSSSEVYGEPFEIPQREATTPLNSRLPYAVVKNLGEAFCRTYQQEFGLPYTIFRFFNTYGPLQSADFVIAKFLSAARLGRDIMIYGDGKQTRTFCYISDNLDLTEALLNKGLAVNETLNVGSDVEMTILELARAIVAFTGGVSKIVHMPPLAEGDMTRRCPDVSRMKEILGKPLVSLDDGVRRTLAGEV